MIREATPADLDEILRIENAAFEQDRLSRRSLRYLLTRARAFTLVDDVGGTLRGYVLVLLRRGTSLARLYSIAVDPAARGHGIGASLVRAAEADALARDCVVMRLEIRKDNAASISLFHTLGYRPFGAYSDYYEDSTEALRYEKVLAPHLDRALLRVPFYAQTLEFTCGPAALMMAMKALDEGIELDRRLELRLWRESTTIYMTSGHGGCGPEGLALAAHARGFGVRIHVNQAGPLLLESVRSAEKRTVIELVYKDFMREVRAKGIPVRRGSVRVDDLVSAFEAGAIPIVLISLYRFHRKRTPHWVTVTGFDERYLYVNDPWVYKAAGRTATDCINLPIPRSEFEGMARWGRAGERAVLFVSRDGAGDGKNQDKARRS
ncbi:MAG: peptidase C39 family protein [Arenicellales bacterium]